jgi:hypothetical protein
VEETHEQQQAPEEVRSQITPHRARLVDTLDK